MTLVRGALMTHQKISVSKRCTDFLSLHLSTPAQFLVEEITLVTVPSGGASAHQQKYQVFPDASL